MFEHASRRRLTAALPLLAFLMLLSSCGTTNVDFPYPAESIVFPDEGAEVTRIHIAAVRDQRPQVQRDGAGHFAGITFPSDASWNRSVADLYHEALARDITQTRLAELTPMSRQADFTLEADIHSFHCRQERGMTSFLLPPAAGLLGGFIWGDDTSSRLKRAGLLAVVAMGALPVPLHVRAEAEVELTLRNAKGEVIWREVCVGEIEETKGEPAASRRDKAFAEEYMPQAVKRCNACLIGQLRQYLLSR